jgi:hypothetical protein
VKTAAENLSARAEQRKLVMVLTDGCGDADSMNMLCRSALDLMGVEIIGIGIGFNPGRPEAAMFDKSYPVLRAYVPNLKALGTTSLATLEKALKKSAKGRRTM